MGLFLIVIFLVGMALDEQLILEKNSVDALLELCKLAEGKFEA